MSNKLWGGRFQKQTDPGMERFSNSLAFDSRLAQADIEAGMAHAGALREAGLINGRESSTIVSTLKKIGADLEAGKLKLDADRYEDIHSLILAELARRTGETGRKLHAGRSRNDLVSLDTRLYLRLRLEEILGGIKALQTALVEQGTRHQELIFPGLTHTQHAQLVLFPHHLLAYVEMLARDRGRLEDALKRLNVLPAGSAALAGSSLPLDQRKLARELGFKQISRNSVDAVSDRDFAIEILAALAIVGMHLSRLAEELVWWSSSEIAFVQLDEAFCTGSSFLPQKLNPDGAELIRGKTGRLYGNLVALLTVMKGLPLSYNRDMQEDKEPLFDSLDAVNDSLILMAGMIRTLEVDEEAVARALEQDHSPASDLAEHLVTRGVPFHDAHLAVGKLVRWCLKDKRDFSSLSLEDLRKFRPEFGPNAVRLLQAPGSIRAKRTLGSTSPRRVRAELERWKKELS